MRQRGMLDLWQSRTLRSLVPKGLDKEESEVNAEAIDNEG